MRRTDDAKSRNIPALAALAACVLILLPVAAAGAVTVCNKAPADICAAIQAGTDPGGGDCDNDALTDREECVGFSTPGTTPRSIDGYNATASNDKLDPSMPDLFFMVTDNNGVPLQPGSLLYEATGGLGNVLNLYSNGLRIAVHRVETAELSGRFITATARAAQIKESTSMDAGGTYLGETKEGLPGYTTSIIYTAKIKDNVDRNCPAGKNCYIKGTSPLVSNAYGTNNAPIINFYIQQVISHEMGHGSMLAPTTASSYWHYSRSGTVMDPSASFSKGVYTIPTLFDPVKDPPAVRLK